VSVHGASYQEVLDRLNQQRPKLEQFLRSQGFDAAEIQTAAPEISPAFLVEHDAHGNEIRTPNGYDGKQQLTVASSKLDRIQSAHQNILALRAGNDAIDFEAPQYLLGNLETIKHSLIKQATEDARRRADEFASTGGGKVGAMRSASQGSFNIYADSGSSGDDEYGGRHDKTTAGKQQRPGRSRACRARILQRHQYDGACSQWPLSASNLSVVRLTPLWTTIPTATS